MNGLPIGDYALLSDCRSAALVSRGGSVDWQCGPRFDSPAFFARILDDDAGHFAIHPAGDFETSRSYAPETMVLETTFRTGTGEAMLTDALALGRDDRGHHLGAGSPGVLLRRLDCTAGELDVEVSYAPRPEYGLVLPILVPIPGGLAARGGADRLVLSGPMDDFRIEAATATACLHLSAGQTMSLALQHGQRWEPPLTALNPDEIASWLDDTKTAWRSWSAIHQTYDGPWRDLVHGSGRVLQALTFYPTGAIVAAPTTSLPEAIGGGRNWDYRYTWVRDASLTMGALWVAACPDEANEFFNYVTTSAAGSLDRGGDLQIMFGVGGERDLTEQELPNLEGWRDSAPVRVGNGAWNQRQLDVYGELLGAVYRLSDHVFDNTSRVGPAANPDKWGAPPDLAPSTRRFFVELADTAARRWQEKDQGIWEIRGEPRDFLYSKLMCWVALDRAVALAGPLDASDRVEGWKQTQAQIREAILTEGWSDRANAFTQSFGSDELDASNLMLSLVGFLPADEPRVLSTINATEERLTDDRGLVYRYRSHDGLQGEEGTFLLCTFWLAQALARAGQPARARTVFERAAAFVNDVGLLAEEVDPSTGELLGNFPQAFSHIGLVNAAWAISEAELGQNSHSEEASAPPLSP